MRPAPKHVYGYPESQLKEMMSEEQFKRFKKFMSAKTISRDKGEAIYYPSDVDGFFKYVG